MTLDLVYPEVWEDYSGLNLDGLDYYGVRRALWLTRTPFTISIPMLRFSNSMHSIMLLM